MASRRFSVWLCYNFNLYKVTLFFFNQGKLPVDTDCLRLHLDDRSISTPRLQLNPTIVAESRQRSGSSSLEVRKSSSTIAWFFNSGSESAHMWGSCHEKFAQGHPIQSPWEVIVESHKLDPTVWKWNRLGSRNKRQISFGGLDFHFLGSPLPFLPKTFRTKGDVIIQCLFWSWID